MSAVNLQEVHDFLVEVAHKAGEMITSANPKQTEAGQKKNSADIVTETDQAVEKMVSTTLRDKFPDFECECLRNTSQIKANDVQLWAKKPTNPAMSYQTSQRLLLTQSTAQTTSCMAIPTSAYLLAWQSNRNPSSALSTIRSLNRCILVSKAKDRFLRMLSTTMSDFLFASQSRWVT
jgi:hypothetical protein